jgi:hypothetical protein
MKSIIIIAGIWLCASRMCFGQQPDIARLRDVKTSPLYGRIKASLDAVRAIDTHDHLRAFDEIPDRVDTADGRGMTLYSIWAHSYLRRTTRLTPWPADGSFATWWSSAEDDFDDARATSFYRYMLPAFRDLYDVEFDSITADQAKKLNSRIYENYESDDWLRKVVTQRDNIELLMGATGRPLRYERPFHGAERL